MFPESWKIEEVAKRVYNEEHGVETWIYIVEFSPAGQDF